MPQFRARLMKIPASVDSSRTVGWYSVGVVAFHLHCFHLPDCHSDTVYGCPKVIGCESESFLQLKLIHTPSPYPVSSSLCYSLRFRVFATYMLPSLNKYFSYPQQIDTSLISLSLSFFHISHISTPSMCRNHRTIYSCTHHHDLVTLCTPTISPLVHRVTTFPYIHTPLSSTGDNPPAHDVILTSTKTPVQCPSCHAAQELPELDVFASDVTQTEASTTDDGATSSGTQPDRRHPDELEKSASNAARIVRATPLLRREAPADAFLSDGRSSLQQSPGCHVKVDTFVPYVGGLGLLVTRRDRSGLGGIGTERRAVDCRCGGRARDRVLARL